MLIKDSCLKEKWTYKCDGSVISVSVTPNCSLISATTVGRSLILLNSEGELIWETDKDALDQEGWSTAISTDGSMVAVGTASKNPADGTVYIFNAQGGEISAITLGSPVWSLSFSSDGNVLAASCWDG